MANSRFCLAVTFLVICAASQSSVVVVGSPTPAIEPGKSIKKANLLRVPMIEERSKETNSPCSATPNSQELPPNAKSATAAAAGSSGAAPAALNHDRDQPNALSKMSSQQQPPKVNVADKLKRGLTNFINHFNPAPFFVPNSAQFAAAGGALQQAPPKLTSTREPPTIVNDGPSADAVIKGPNRLVQARRLGGPLRWGRR